MNENRRTIQFTGALGAPLAARLDLPQEKPLAFALFAHCFTCSKDTLASTRISAALVEQGVAVLRFDFTGLGGSEGDFANTNFSSNVADLVAAADYLRENFEAPKLLVGHSLGGAAVLAAAAKIAEAAAVATINAPYDPGHVRHLIQHAAPEIEAAGEAEVSLAGRKFRIKKQFLEDLAQLDSRQAIGSLGKALLVFHTPGDTVVPVDNAAKIFMAARHPKSFVSLDDADHLISRKEDAQYIGQVLTAWVSRYLGEPAAAASEPPPPEGMVQVAEAGTGKFAQWIRVGHHRLHADEPVSVGGDDSGPAPYDLLLAGLGACTAMTLRMYAARKQWPLERIAVELRHEKIHTADCGSCDSREGKLDRIERVVELTGNLDESQRARLIEIANKCPVHRTLQSEVLIPTRLKD